jgi:hypothetical protein
MIIPFSETAFMLRRWSKLQLQESGGTNWLTRFF